jgi:hypothetical protein
LGEGAVEFEDGGLEAGGVHGWEVHAEGFLSHG